MYIGSTRVVTFRPPTTKVVYREARRRSVWSINGAKRAQPVATGRKSKGRENGSNRPIRNRCQPTATVSQRMVRRGRRFESARGLR